MMDRGLALQGTFANIDTENPDLSSFKAAGGKLITVSGWADNRIPGGWTVNYYERVMTTQGSVANAQSFYSLFMVPGHGHGSAVNGTANPSANPPLPDEDSIYTALKNWVENGTASNTLVFSTKATTANPTVKSMPMCPCPQKQNYVGGDIPQASSYTCS